MATTTSADLQSLTTNQHDENGEDAAGIRRAQGNDISQAWRFWKVSRQAHTFKSLSLV
jgi:hypothetical protein